MKKLLTNFLDFILFSNIFIGLCAVAQGLVTYHLLNIQPNYNLLIMLFFGTVLTYNFSIILINPQKETTSPFKRIRWFSKNYKLYKAVTLLSLISCIVLFFTLNKAVQLVLIFLGLVCTIYTLPFIKRGNLKFGIRHLPFVKLFLIATVWALSCVLLPVLQTGLQLNIADLSLLIAKRLLFIMALTIPFDIRDLYQDKSLNLKTIPVAYGERKALIFCQLLLALYLLMLFGFEKNFTLNVLALGLTILISGWLIFKANFKKNEYYYFFGLDGLLILQYLSLIIFNYTRYF